MTEAILTLKDDRKLSYAVYGPPDGKPVLYFHVSPSSRREILLLKSFGVDLDRLLWQAGLKIIAPDRGALTTYQSQRSFLSYAADAMELLQHLGDGPCSVLCWSGGGPYALATAYQFRSMVNGVYILCGIARQFDKAVLQQMGMNKYYFIAAKHAPLLLHAGLNFIRKKKITQLPRQQLTGLPYIDYRLLQPHVQELASLTMKEATRKGTRAMVQEANLYFSPYGFPLSDIQQTIHYWWGTLDMSVVELHAREVEQKALHPVMHYREGEGHLSLYIKCFAEALEEIARGNA